MKQMSFGFLLLWLLIGCTETEPSKSTRVDPVKIEVIETFEMSQKLTDRYQDAGLVPVTDSRILVDLRYATNNNFMHAVLYDTLNRLFLQKAVSVRLSLCQDYLDSVRPGFRLKVFDGTRPLQVQQEMWTALDSIPVFRRGKFVSNPLFGSVHNFGTAVDLTICGKNGEELDMGAGYDDFREIAFPSLEARFLKEGKLTQTQVDNRKLLREVMRSQRFSNIPSEWWHFNAFSRAEAEMRFQILLNESGDHKRWHAPRISVDSTRIQLPDPVPPTEEDEIQEM